MTKEHYNSDAEMIRGLVAVFLEHWFGKRCSVFNADCECCRRWKLLDDLVMNPFEENE